jgi:cell wall-associated NlpC family hydrolase
VIIALVAAAVGLAVPGVGGTLPPRPDNPSDQDIVSGQAHAQGLASRVGKLTNQLAEADARLNELAAQVELRMEDANKARVDLTRAQQAHALAERGAASAAVEVSAAERKIEDERRRLDDFAARSYRQGSVVGSLSALVGARDPKEVLDRAEMLDAISASSSDLLESLHGASAERANKDSLARKALQDAEAARAAADTANAMAEEAENSAISAQASQVQQNQALEATKARVEGELEQARARVQGLRSQHNGYQAWLELKSREEQASDAASAQSAAQPVASQPASSGRSVETVIDRALSQLGMPYAWGGGNANGPTRGVRDGGVADAHGDFRKIGFDCSGLMIYAFGGAGVELDHYSGYQYQAGRKVPLAQMQRGDMLFWQSGGKTHHVALYLGGGQMVEAPYSGSQVRVSPVRYGGIAPYAIRVL